MHRRGTSRLEHCEAVRVARLAALDALLHSRRARRPRTWHLMKRIDEQYLRTPFYGSRKLAHVLSESIANACSG